MVDYKELKTCILDACIDKGQGFNANFGVDEEKLSSSVEALGLRLIDHNVRCSSIRPTEVPCNQEYLTGQRLEWIDEYKKYTILTFVPIDCINDDLQHLLDVIDAEFQNKKGLDFVKTYAKITANYPCYFALVISYLSNDPKCFGHNSYEIKCRANTVLVKSASYTYNHNDI